MTRLSPVTRVLILAAAAAVLAVGAWLTGYPWLSGFGTGMLVAWIVVLAAMLED